MAQDQVSIADAVAEGAGVARWAWRRAGPIQLVAAAGLALVFVGLRGPQAGGALMVGLVVSLAAWAPLWAGLHRLALGGGAAERMVRGGLQFGPAELRFLVLGAALALAAGFSVLPLVAVSAILIVLLHDLGAVALGPLGAVPGSLVVAAAVWLAAAGGLGYAAARLALAPAATVGRRRLVLVEAWEITRHRAGSIAAAWFLAQAPALLCLSLLAFVDSLEQRNALGSGGHWPMPDAVVAGAVLGLVAAFVQAPLTAGVLGFLYRADREERLAAAFLAQPANAEPFAA